MLCNLKDEDVSIRVLVMCILFQFNTNDMKGLVVQCCACFGCLVC